MPWYYAGPEAKPVGPLSVEELHARHVSGIVTAETYVIEHADQPIENWTWKRYREVFPTNLPPIPPPAALPPAVPVPPVAQPHPLFPSAASIPTQHPAFPSAARPDPYYNIKPTNGWCAWGFGLAVAAFFLTFITCGIGGILGFPSLFVCVVGLAKLHKNRELAGQGLAVAGLVLSGIVLLISLVLMIWLAVPILKAHGLTVTEQTSNDSE